MFLKNSIINGKMQQIKKAELYKLYVKKANNYMLKEQTNKTHTKLYSF